MNKQIKMIALDLDGTLIGSDGLISTYSIQVLNMAIQRGISVCIITGRGLAFLPAELSSLPGIRYVATCNGAVITDIIDNKVIETHTLTAEFVLSIWHIFSKLDAVLFFVIDGFFYTDSAYLIARNFDSKLRDSLFEENLILVDDLFNFLLTSQKSVEKICVVFKDPIALKESLPHFYKISGIALTTTSERFLDINNPNVTKGRALQSISNILSIHQKSILGIGDDINDIDMLKKCGTGLAMGNAMDELKSIADSVILPNSQDGAAKAIENFILAAPS